MRNVLMLSDKLNSRLKKGAGRIVWAFDPQYGEKDPFSKFKATFSEIQENIAAVKFNRQLIIPLIMDAKINDIGYTNESIARNYFDTGFDAVICNPFIGKDGLTPIIKAAEDLNKDVILLVYMSHSSANFGYGRKVVLTESEKNKFGKEHCYYYELFADLVNEIGATGCIVGATYPEKIQAIRSILNNDKLIFSPGVGAQGGDSKKSRAMGMDYAIIGRAITEGQNVKKYCEQMTKELQ